MTRAPSCVPITEPLRIPLAAGWFSMGSDVGQAVEGPVHRIWLDTFSMAATQVTVEEYARFLDATGNVPPHIGAIPTSLIGEPYTVTFCWRSSVRIIGPIS